MGYTKILEDGYIIAVTIGGSGETITEQEYNEILEVIHSKPTAQPPYDYRLKTDLTWELYEIKPPEPSEDVDDSEALEILLGGGE